MEINFPFRMLKTDIFLTLDVLMFINYEAALKFMFSLNKLTRLFILQNFIIVRNGFTNDGLIDFCFSKVP